MGLPEETLGLSLFATLYRLFRYTYMNPSKTPRYFRSGLLATTTLVLLCLSGCDGGDFSKLELLPAQQYLAKPIDFLGNTYVIRAQIDSQIRWEKGVGRLLAVLPEGSNKRLPVYVPAEAGSNIHIGQRFEMRVRVEEGGLIYVEALRKF